MLIGHQKILQFFEKAQQSGELNHAYIFVGPSQVGKKTVAKYITSNLLGRSIEQLTSNPDFYYIERVEDEKTEKLKKDISVEQIRVLKNRMRSKSWLGGYQVVFIDEAELLNEEGSNAILKLLEEPPEKSIFFLITQDDQKLLPTIRSRAQLVFFSLVPEQEIKVALESWGAGSKQAEELARDAWGRPGRAVEFFQDEEVYKKYVQEVERFNSLLGQPFYKKLKLLEDLFGKGEKEDHIRNREELDGVLELWIMKWREKLLAEQQPANQKKIISILDSLEQARVLLKQNIHPKILVEQVVLEF
jgi:DNA polymerase-3 subunit delta'